MQRGWGAYGEERLALEGAFDVMVEGDRERELEEKDRDLGERRHEGGA
jgi:hypothetical protein